MEDWKTICRVDDIPSLGARRVRRPAGGDVAVFRTADDRVFALLDRCPHKGGPLSQGIVFGEHVACPLHNWAIALEDGQARAPDVGCTTKFAVRVIDGVVSLRGDELATLAIDEVLAGVGGAIARSMTDQGGATACDTSAAVSGQAVGLSPCAQSQGPRTPKTIPIVAA